MEEWISKKDLLLETGISYGQLYRWKREKLIPDAWFEKRSAYTGQETYFPRALALERVRFILAHKDEYSLTALRELLSPDARSRAYAVQALKSVPGAARSATLFARRTGLEQLNHGQALSVLIGADYDNACAPGDEAVTRLTDALNAWEDAHALYARNEGRVYVVSDGARQLPLYSPSDETILLPEGASIVFSVAVRDFTQTYTHKLNKILGHEVS